MSKAPNDPSGEFASRLRTLREKMGYSQADLARRSGVTAAAISQLENASREPSFSTIIRLSEALSTTPNDLMGVFSDERIDESLKALFRDVSKLSQSDYAKVEAFARFLKDQKDRES